jgi:hypothetical protein
MHRDPLTLPPHWRRRVSAAVPVEQTAEREGFEPSIDEKTPITFFETAAFNRSATSPDDDGEG